MRKKIFLRVVLPVLLFIQVLPGCRQAYTPPVAATQNSYLVVEGFINNGPDSTVFTLSHTFNLNDTAQVSYETQAKVTVEGKDNSSYPLTEIGNGQYGSLLAGLNNSVSYRLHILTSSGREYASAYVPVKVSPPIDSVFWLKNDTGVQIYVNTHDPSGSTRYYRWDYQETWEFHSAYYATLYFGNDSIKSLQNNNYYFCWQSNVSNNILISSSAKLTQDQIYRFPINLILTGSEQITVKYSMLVRQYALTPDAYAWWQLMQKNTEQLGSFFGVQPTAISGNIHNLADTSELVIGYVSAGSISRQRIFISVDQVQPWVYDYNCSEKITSGDSVPFFISNGWMLVDIAPTSSIIPRYDIAWRTCVDCRFLGSNQKPSFWQ